MPHSRVSTTQLDRPATSDKSALVSAAGVPPKRTDRSRRRNKPAKQTWAHALRKDWKLSSFLTASNLEVDLVIETADSVIGIEIKAGHTLHAKRHSGLRTLEEMVRGYKPAKKWIVFTGEREQLLSDDVHVFPYNDALRQLAQIA